jgi:hypothetical protein
METGQLAKARELLDALAAEGFEYNIDEERFRILLAELSGDTAGTLERGRRAMATIEGYTGVHQTQSIQCVAALEALACANLLNARWQPCAEAAREAAIAAASSVGNWIAPPLLAQLAEAELGLGDIEAARRTADQAVARMRKHETRGRETRALLARARVLLVNRTDLIEQCCIHLRPSRCRSRAPRVVAAGGDTQHAAHRGDAMLGLVSPHELESFGGIEPVSRANQAAAFFSISHSSRSVFTSRPKPTELLAFVARQTVGAYTVVAISLRDPIPDRLRCRLELLSQLLRRSTRTDQIYEPVTELSRVRRTGLCHRELLFPRKGFGVHWLRRESPAPRASVAISTTP